MSDDTILINGCRYSSASVVAYAVIDGANIRLSGLQKIDYDDACKPGVVTGQGGRKIGRTAGKFEGSASWGLARYQFLVVQAALKAAGEALDPQIPIAQVPFDVLLTYQPESRGGATQTDSVKGARMTTRKTGVDTGSVEGSVVESELDIMDVLIDGVSLWHTAD